MRDWLDVLVTESGLLVAQQTIERPPLMVAQMTEEWLNYYRKIAQSHTIPGRRLLKVFMQFFNPSESGWLLVDAEEWNDSSCD